MPTPKAGYYLDGVRIPATTSILSRFKDAGGIIHWAWALGMEGKDYREVKQEAADAGTCAHDMAECYVTGRAFDPSPYSVETLARAENGFTAFRNWAEQSRLEIDPTRTELSLISKVHAFGGTIDAPLRFKGKRRLGDYKTSNAVYVEYLMQMAAYGILWDETFPEDPITGYDLIRFDKTYADFAHFSFNELDDAREEFLHLRKAYELDQKLKKRLR